MDKTALIAHYAALKEKQGKTNKGAPEYYAYHQIGTALASEDTEKALRDKMQHCYDSIAEHPDLKGRTWWYGEMIEHFEKALKTLEDIKCNN